MPSIQRFRALGLATFSLLLVFSSLALAAVNVGQLFYEGEVVRTLVPPAASPHEGTAPLYVIMEGAEGQLPVAGAGPGDRNYRGGQWAFNSVTWNVAPYLLRSGDAVMAAASAGDVTVTRVAGNDFKCPIQP